MQNSSGDADVANDPTEAETESTTDLNDLESLESLLKLTASISLEYVPGSDYKAEEMTFTWILTKFDTEGIAMEIEFDNPDGVSSYAQDSMKMVFQNTNFFL